EPVVEDHIPFYAKLSREGLSLQPILVAFAPANMRMSCPGDYVNRLRMFGNDAWQRFDHVFDPLVGREQSEGEQHCLTFGSRGILVEVRIAKGQVRNAVRDEI